MDNNFIIPLSELTRGRNEFEWSVGTGFFHEFGNCDITDAELRVSVKAEKSGHCTWLDCAIEGTVSVQCDRCLGKLEYPVCTEIKLSLKYGRETSEWTAEETREIVCIPENDTDFDMSQIIYDYACLSLPMQRVHPYDECDPEMLKHLGEPSASATESGYQEAANPFSALKDMLDR